MRYTVKLSAPEEAALAALVGTLLDRVLVDGWAAELRAGVAVLPVVPDEVATPDADHPYGTMERPKLLLGEGPYLSESATALAEELGLVRAVNAITILVGFTPVVDFPARELSPGVILPPSRGYGWTYFPPGQREQAEREVGTGALVELDVAFELVCDGCPSLVVYTRGYFIKVSLDGLPAGEDWVAFGTFVRRPLSAGCSA